MKRQGPRAAKHGLPKNFHPHKRVKMGKGILEKIKEATIPSVNKLVGESASWDCVSASTVRKINRLARIRTKQLQEKKGQKKKPESQKVSLDAQE